MTMCTGLDSGTLAIPLSDRVITLQCETCRLGRLICNGCHVKRKHAIRTRFHRNQHRDLQSFSNRPPGVERVRISSHQPAYLLTSSHVTMLRVIFHYLAILQSSDVKPRTSNINTFIHLYARGKRPSDRPRFRLFRIHISSTIVCTNKYHCQCIHCTD